MQTQTVKTSKYNEQTVKSFAKLCIVKPDLAMSALLGQSEPEDLIDALGSHPGAVEALYRADNCPKNLKGVLLETLEESGQFILS